eukprot:sb/3468089/
MSVHPEPAHLEPEPIPIEVPVPTVMSVSNQRPIRPPPVKEDEFRSQGQPLEPPGVLQGQGPSNDTPGQSTSMTNFIEHLTGNHVSQRIHVRSKVKRKVLLPLSGILCREFLDSYGGDFFCPEKPDDEKVAIFAAMEKKSMTSIFKTDSLLRGLSVLEKRREILNDVSISKKSRHNKVSNLQRTDRKHGAGQLLYETFLEKTGLTEESSVEDIEKVCGVALVIVDGDGFIKYISPRILDPLYRIEVFLEEDLLDNKQLYCVANFKGLCRVDKVK